MAYDKKAFDSAIKEVLSYGGGSASLDNTTVNEAKLLEALQKIQDGMNDEALLLVLGRATLKILSNRVSASDLRSDVESELISYFKSEMDKLG